MNDYEIMIQRINNDFQLELKNPDECNISKEIRKNKNKEMMNDLELLDKLDFLIRRGKARIVIDE